MTHTSTEQELYEQWKKSYALEDEPNYCVGTDFDCNAAFMAGMQAARRAPAVPQGCRMVPTELLERATESLGSFVSDHGWGQADIDTFDDLSALATPQPPEATVKESLTVEAAQLDDINVVDISQAVGLKEAAPVQMPEPAVPYAIFDRHGFYVDMTTKAKAQSFCDHYNKRDADGGGSAPYTVQALYTEQQVRQILSTLQK